MHQLAPRNRSYRRRTHRFRPEGYSLNFSGSLEPVLRIRPGDSVEATSIDSSGFDEAGVDTGFRYNALTGPFHIEGAMPGDVLAVKLERIRLNRPEGLAYSGISERAYTPAEYARSLERARLYHWKLDLASLTATTTLTERLKRVRLPLRPFLGCIGVAPSNGESVSALYAGPFGGNIDYNRLVEGTTLYFPVSVEGAHFYFGDGHATQGDGESSGGAIETSMAVRFSVEIIPGLTLPGFRAESREFYMAAGVGQPLDEAYQRATANMVDWLTTVFGFDRHEAYVLIGVNGRIDVANTVNGRGNTVVCKLDRRFLDALSRGAPASKTHAGSRRPR